VRHEHVEGLSGKLAGLAHALEGLRTMQLDARFAQLGARQVEIVHGCNGKVFVDISLGCLECSEKVGARNVLSARLARQLRVPRRRCGIRRFAPPHTGGRAPDWPALRQRPAGVVGGEAEVKTR
jgi:hypothetical protein